MAANGNNACECTDGVCAKCCKEECNANGTHTCSWQEPKTCVTTELLVADDACADGYTRAYTGVNCAGGAGSDWEAEHGNTGCDCTDGVCAQCCKEECTDDNTHVCYWEVPQTYVEPSRPEPLLQCHTKPNPNPCRALLRLQCRTVTVTNPLTLTRRRRPV